MNRGPNGEQHTEETNSSPKVKMMERIPQDFFLLRETSREQKELGILTNLYISLPSAPCFPISTSPCKHFDIPTKIASSTCSLASLEVNGRQYFPTNEDSELHHCPRLECLFLCYLHVVFPKLQSLFDQRCQSNKRNRSTSGIRKLHASILRPAPLLKKNPKHRHLPKISFIDDSSINAFKLHGMK